jgi:hypothetical protein
MKAMEFLEAVTFVLALLKFGGAIDISWWWVVSPILFGVAFLTLTALGVRIYNLFAKKKVKIVGIDE